MGVFDLPIAIGILVASAQLQVKQLSQYEFAGELALTGELRSFKGALAFALSAKNTKRDLIMPVQNAKEAALVDGVCIYGAAHFSQVFAHLTGQMQLNAQPHAGKPEVEQIGLDLADITGQTQAQRALEISAAGGHSLLFIGPPGSGKTMLASRLPGILPPMSYTEALETAAILSLSQKGFEPKQFRQRPFRAPHHTTSSAALVGGSSPPKPGEISLAHNGVLFLDELPEYQRHVLETLREPIESGSITISRAAYQLSFPARFQLVCAMNPCPCGHYGDTQKSCRCTPEQVQRYQGRISGPLLDRIDLHINVPTMNYCDLFSKSTPIQNSLMVRKRTTQASLIQQKRQNCANALLNNQQLQQYCALSDGDQALLANAMEKLKLSARAYHRILRIGRTIADLDHSETILRTHLLEALNYRPKAILHH